MPDTHLNVWARALASQCREALNELSFLVPWTQMPAPAEWIADFPQLGEIPTLHQLARIHTNLAPALEQRLADHTDPEHAERVSALDQLVYEGSRRAAERMLLIDQLALQSAEFARMEYGLLYHPATHLLASEARLAAFVAIAQGQPPQESWFALGRQLTVTGGEPNLLSRSGSMFEYLMPLLVMPTFENTLLDKPYHSAVARQIEYGTQRSVPWGISESGYNMAFARMGDNQRAWELLQMINPVNHGKTAKDIAKYKVEPYVVAADVYAASPHVGRGGWTWYTGSSGWMYRLIVGSLLGLKLEGDKLTITPCLPDDWGTYGLNYRYRDTIYRIVVTQGSADGVAGNVKVDGVEQMDGMISLVDDKREHAVEILVHARLAEHPGDR